MVQCDSTYAQRGEFEWEINKLAHFIIFNLFQVSLIIKQET